MTLNLDKQKEIQTTKDFSPLEDIPLWLKSMGDWFNNRFNNPEASAEAKRQYDLQVAEQDRQNRIFLENIQNSLRPPDFEKAGQQANKVLSDIGNWSQGINQMNVGKSMMDVANPVNSIPQAMGIMGDIFTPIQKGAENVLSQTPMAGKDIRPYSQDIETWNPESENPLLKSVGITPKGLMGTLGDPTNLLGMGAPFKFAKGADILSDVVKALGKGISRDELLKVLVESPITKAKIGRNLPLQEAENLLKTAEASLSKAGKPLEGVGGTKTPESGKILQSTIKPTTVKEPWQMTKDKFEHSYLQHTVLRSDAPDIGVEGFRTGIGPNAVSITRGKPTNIIETKYGTKEGKRTYLIPKEYIIGSPNGPKIKEGWKPTPSQEIIPEYDYQPSHEAVIKKALKEGKPVPPEVLKDYPDLAKTVQNPVQQTVPPNLPPVTPVPPIPPPPPAGSGYDMLRNMYEAGRKVPKVKPEKMTWMERWNDSYYKIKQTQGRVEKLNPIQPGGEKDVITYLDRAPGAGNAGLYRAKTLIDNISKVAPQVPLDDVRIILDNYHFREVLAEKGANRVMSGGITDTRQLDDIMPRLQQKLGQDNFNKALQAAELVRNGYSEQRAMMVKSGLISVEDSAELAAKYPWYNPLQYVDDIARTGRKADTFTVANNGLKSLSETGTAESTRDFLDTLVRTYASNEVRIVENDTAKAIVKLALDDPTLVDKVTKKSLIRPVAQVGDDVIFRPTHQEIPGTISFFENGKRQVYEVPEFIYREAVTMKKALGNPTSSFIGSLNGVSRAAFTSASPAFVVSNILNDSLTAFMRNGILPTETAGRLIKSLFGLSNDKIYQAFNLAGAHQARFYGEDILKQIEKSGGDILRKDQSFLSKVWKSIPSAGEAGEQAPRVAAFERELNKTLPTWRSMTAEEISATAQGRHAAATAVESTINFGRGGYMVKNLNPFVLFLNASMEGTKLPFRTLRDSPTARWRLAGVGAGVTALTAYNLSFPEYLDVPNNIRWGSVVVMLPSKEKDAYGKNKPNYLTIIPRTREWGAFLAPLTYGVEKMYKDNPTDFGTFSATMAPMLSPISTFPAPVLIEELFGQAANYDFYRSQPIVPPEMANLPNNQQVQPWVSPTNETIANVTGQSPLRVQHAAQGLFGGAGQAITSVTDYVAALIAPKQYDPKIVSLADEYAKLDSKVAKNTLLMKLSTDEKNSMFAYINRPQKGVPIISSVVGRVVGDRGGQLYKTGQDVAQKETGISPTQTKETGSVLRKVSDIHLERQKSIDKSFESGTITGTQWKDERASLGQRYQGALDALKIKAPNAAQVQDNGDLATQYYKVINTLAGTMDDARDRVDVLASGWYAIDLQETDPGKPDWSTYNKMKDDFLASLKPEDKVLLDEYLKSKMTPTEKVYAHAQEVLKPYWGVTDYVWGKYPPEIKGIADAIARLGVMDPAKEKEALQRFPQIVTIRSQIAQMKKLMSDKDPRIKGYIRMFYGG